ncbi:hypothetical protein PENANT_c051G00492 [Penicillium antarcticum]|uniref:Phosphatidylglycerol/phosphatidylinositol transfer protein n=1 Tax=Penicillium antarcticum TaxID=416450 RepID=A0A1V6PRT6_9EURO|nr:uncharacterized protein N7508_000283 [Penicillium antarcticum]KAJ5320000.1 hypothetical protein N7508_000283 [Penicillium antarcticum]OQD79427.1 hypothetical protein PENANT_c051G00492 [Penicillium antarcticum]
MKFLSAGLLALTVPLANAAAFSLFDPSQVSLKTDEPKFPVEGDNPLNYCADPASYRLEIESVDLTPNPPQAGQKLIISAEGTLLDRVEKGAKVNLEVKWGLITLISQTVDLCDELKNVDMACPLEKGKMVLTKEVELPKQIPPGSYSVLADVYNKDLKQVTCLTATNIQFHL